MTNQAVDVWLCDANGEKMFVCTSTVADLLRQAEDCCDDDEVRGIRKPLKDTGSARMAANAGSFFEYILA